MSITRLDRAAIEHFHPSRPFDVVARTRLTEQIETRKRDEIEQLALHRVSG